MTENQLSSFSLSSPDHIVHLTSIKHGYLSVEVVVQVALLVLRTQHVHHLAVLGGARRALRLAFSVTFEAVLVEGMAAQEVN